MEINNFKLIYPLVGNDGDENEGTCYRVNVGERTYIVSTAHELMDLSEEIIWLSNKSKEPAFISAYPMSLETFNKALCSEIASYMLYNEANLPDFYIHRAFLNTPPFEKVYTIEVNDKETTEKVIEWINKNFPCKDGNGSSPYLKGVVQSIKGETIVTRAFNFMTRDIIKAFPNIYVCTIYPKLLLFFNNKE